MYFLTSRWKQEIKQKCCDIAGTKSKVHQCCFFIPLQVVIAFLLPDLKFCFVFFVTISSTTVSNGQRLLVELLYILISLFHCFPLHPDVWCSYYIWIFFVLGRWVCPAGRIKGFLKVKIMCLHFWSSLSLCFYNESRNVTNEKKFFTQRLGRHWHRLSGEVMDAPYLEVFNNRLKRLLGSLI